MRFSLWWSPSGAGLVMNVIPDDDITSPCSGRITNCEHQALLKGLLQHIQHFIPFPVVRQVCSALNTCIVSTWIGVAGLEKEKTKLLNKETQGQKVKENTKSNITQV